MQFWFLEGMLRGAMADRPRRADLPEARPYFE
jgi:hypothetical protein